MSRPVLGLPKGPGPVGPRGYHGGPTPPSSSNAPPKLPHSQLYTPSSRGSGHAYTSAVQAQPVETEARGRRKTASVPQQYVQQPVGQHVPQAQQYQQSQLVAQPQPMQQPLLLQQQQYAQPQQQHMQPQQQYAQPQQQHMQPQQQYVQPQQQHMQPQQQYAQPQQQHMQPQQQQYAQLQQQQAQFTATQPTARPQVALQSVASSGLADMLGGSDDEDDDEFFEVESPEPERERPVVAPQVQVTVQPKPEPTQERAKPQVQIQKPVQREARPSHVGERSEPRAPEQVRSLSPRIMSLSPRQMRGQRKPTVSTATFQPNLDRARQPMQQLFGKTINRCSSATFKSSVRRECKWFDRKKKEEDKRSNSTGVSRGRVTTSEKLPVKSTFEVRDPHKPNALFVSKVPRAAFLEKENSYILTRDRPVGREAYLKQVETVNRLTKR